MLQHRGLLITIAALPSKNQHMSIDNRPPGNDTAQSPAPPGTPQISAVVATPLLHVLPTDTITADGDKPSIELPGVNRLIIDTAAELGELLRDTDLFERNNEVVLFDNKTHRIKPISAQAFRSWVEGHARGFKYFGEERILAEVSMSADIAQAILASHHFICKLRRLRQVNTCRQPVLRQDGHIELLPEGYDETTQTLTLSGVQFAEDMDLGSARNALQSVFAEFCFVDSKRALAVAIAAMVGVFAVGLLPPHSLRPCFIVLANGEGAGKTLLVKLIVFPTFGSVPVGSRPEREEEFEKVLLIQVREGKMILFLDNLKGHLASPRLEAFLSSEVWRGRILGHSTSYEGENLSTCFITGNGLTVSSDMRRRALFTELHLAVERAEDRKFQFELDDAALRDIRPNLLSALWALVRNWDAVGRPGCSRSHSAFPAWARVIGGIVEAAGFGCCIDPAQVAAAADQDGEDMRQLVHAMTEGKRTNYAFEDLVRLALELGCFESILGVGTSIETDLGMDKKLSPAQCSRLGRLLSRYDNRQILDCRFVVSGKGHSRRYSVARLQVGEPPVPAQTQRCIVQEHPRVPTSFEREVADD